MSEHKEPRCDECKFSRPTTVEVSKIYQKPIVLCHRFPPHMIVTKWDNKNPVLPSVCGTYTLADNWCGEFQSKFFNAVKEVL